jgi:hypothetical protein
VQRDERLLILTLDGDRLDARTALRLEDRPAIGRTYKAVLVKGTHLPRACGRRPF